MVEAGKETQVLARFHLIGHLKGETLPKPNAKYKFDEFKIDSGEIFGIYAEAGARGRAFGAVGAG